MQPTHLREKILATPCSSDLPHRNNAPRFDYDFTCFILAFNFLCPKYCEVIYGIYLIASVWALAEDPGRLSLEVQITSELFLSLGHHCILGMYFIYFFVSHFLPNAI